MSNTQTTPDFAALKTRAGRMSIAELEYAAKDAFEAAQCAEALEAAKCYVSKTGGFYRDEASVYRTELRIRRSA